MTNTNDPDPLAGETNDDVRTVYNTFAGTPVWVVTDGSLIFGVGDTKDMAVADAEEWVEEEYLKYVDEWHSNRYAYKLYRNDCGDEVEDEDEDDEPMDIDNWTRHELDLKRGTRRLARWVKEYGGAGPFALNDDNILDICD